MIRKKGRLLGLAFAVALSAFSVCSLVPSMVYAVNGEEDTSNANKGEDTGDRCTSIIFNDRDCENIDENTILELVKFCVTFLIRGVGIIGAIGVFIAGFLYLTARDNEAQVAKAKKRLIDVFIGLLVYGVFWAAYELFIPLHGLNENDFTSSNVGIVAMADQLGIDAAERGVE